MPVAPRARFASKGARVLGNTRQGLHNVKSQDFRALRGKERRGGLRFPKNAGPGAGAIGGGLGGMGKHALSDVSMGTYHYGRPGKPTGLERSAAARKDASQLTSGFGSSNEYVRKDAVSIPGVGRTLNFGDDDDDDYDMDGLPTDKLLDKALKQLPSKKRKKIHTATKHKEEMNKVVEMIEQLLSSRT